MVYEVRAHTEGEDTTNQTGEYSSMVPGQNGGVGSTVSTTEVKVGSNGVLNDETIIKMGNTEMTAAQAYQHGFIQKDAAGNYVNPNSLAAQVSSEDGGSGSDSSDGDVDESGFDETLLADPETEARLEEMTQAAGSSAIMETNVLKALDGAESDKAMTEVGEKLGISSDPEAVRETASNVYEALTLSAVTLVESKMPDVNASEAFEWAGANMSKAEIIDAQIKWYNGDPSGLMGMVDKYKAR